MFKDEHLIWKIIGLVFCIKNIQLTTYNIYIYIYIYIYIFVYIYKALLGEVCYLSHTHMPTHAQEHTKV